MAYTYDASKDECFESFLYDGDKLDLEVSVHSYSKGSPKVQIGPRFFHQTGEKVAGKVGRLSMDEVEWLIAILGETLKYKK